MKITYGPIKNQRNIAKRGLSFDRVVDLDWSDPLITMDNRQDYGETRFIAQMKLDGRLHIVVFTEVTDGLRIISFRKANKREVNIYEQSTVDR